MKHWIIEDTIVSDGRTLRLRIRKLPNGEEPNSMGFIYGPFNLRQAEKERERLKRIREKEGWEVL